VFHITNLYVLHVQSSKFGAAAQPITYTQSSVTPHPVPKYKPKAFLYCVFSLQLCLVERLLLKFNYRVGECADASTNPNLNIVSVSKNNLGVAGKAYSRGRS